MVAGVSLQLTEISLSSSAVSISSPESSVTFGILLRVLSSNTVPWVYNMESAVGWLVVSATRRQTCGADRVMHGWLQVGGWAVASAGVVPYSQRQIWLMSASTRSNQCPKSSSILSRDSIFCAWVTLVVCFVFFCGGARSRAFKSISCVEDWARGVSFLPL